MDDEENGKQHHPAVAGVLRWFSYEHLDGPMRDISKKCHSLAHSMAGELDGTELTVGLRKLLESKDCFVRAQLEKLERR